MNIEGITIVSPMWGERTTTDRMVFSVLHQYLGKDDPLHVELVLVDDYIEKRGEDGSSPYDFYVSEEFRSSVRQLHCSRKYRSQKRIWKDTLYPHSGHKVPWLQTV